MVLTVDLTLSLSTRYLVESYENRLFFQTKLLFGLGEHAVLHVFDDVSILKRSALPFVHDERSYVPPLVRVIETVRVNVHVMVNIHARVNDHANDHESVRVNDFENELVQILA